MTDRLGRDHDRDGGHVHPTLAQNSNNVVGLKGLNKDVTCQYSPVVKGAIEHKDGNDTLVTQLKRHWKQSCRRPWWNCLSG